jgi:hypothetical protein
MMNVVIQSLDMLGAITVELSEEREGVIQVFRFGGSSDADPAGETISVGTRAVADWCATLRRLRMPAIYESPRVLDGTYLNVEIVDGATVASYSWPDECNLGWSGLGRVVKQIIREATRNAV